MGEWGGVSLFLIWMVGFVGTLRWRFVLGVGAVWEFDFEFRVKTWV